MIAYHTFYAINSPHWDESKANLPLMAAYELISGFYKNLAERPKQSKHGELKIDWAGGRLPSPSKCQLVSLEMGMINRITPDTIFVTTIERVIPANGIRACCFQTFPIVPNPKPNGYVFLRKDGIYFQPDEDEEGLLLTHEDFNNVRIPEGNSRNLSIRMKNGVKFLVCTH